MEEIVELKNISAAYEGTTVLHDVNFTIRDKDFVGIIGPNGGGKTTLLKVILGLLKPTAGEVVYHGAKQALFAFPLELIRHRQRHVRHVVRQVEEERIVLVALNESDGIICT